MLSRGATRLPYVPTVFLKLGIPCTRSFWSPRSESDTNKRPPRPPWRGDDQPATSAYNPPNRHWRGDDQPATNAHNPPNRYTSSNDCFATEVDTAWRPKDQSASRVRNTSYDDDRQRSASDRNQFATGMDYASNDRWKPNDLWRQHDKPAPETDTTAETAETDTEVSEPRRKRRRKKSDEDTDSPVISRWKYDDLESFKSYAASIELDPDSLDYRERAYEYVAVLALFSKNMQLKRPKSGFSDDMDLVGRWLLPKPPLLPLSIPVGIDSLPQPETGEQPTKSVQEPPPLSQFMPIGTDPPLEEKIGEQPIKSIRVIIQCEVVAEKSLDRLARRLQRNVRVSPNGTVGFLACPERLTNKARNLIRFQHRPMGYIRLSETGIISEIFWNRTMENFLVPGLDVGMQDVDVDPQYPDIKQKAVLRLNEVLIDGFLDGKEIPPPPVKVKVEEKKKKKATKPVKKVYR